MYRLQEILEGYKTYIVLAFWLIAEVVNFLKWIDLDINAIRVIAIPLTGITINAKLNRTLQ